MRRPRFVFDMDYISRQKCDNPHNVRQVVDRNFPQIHMLSRVKRYCAAHELRQS